MGEQAPPRPDLPQAELSPEGTARPSPPPEGTTRPSSLVVTKDEAANLVPRKALLPVRDFFVHWGEALSAALEHRLWGFGYQRLDESLESFGRFFLRSDAPVPQLWMGIAWAVDDAPGTLPSWGVSLQIDGDWVRDWQANEGGLRRAMDQAARDSGGRLGLYRFDEHVELAEWRSMEWLLEQPNQAAALVEFWESALDLLAAAGIPEALDAFVARALGHPGGV